MASARPSSAAGPLLLRAVARSIREQRTPNSPTARRLDALAAWLEVVEGTALSPTGGPRPRAVADATGQPAGDAAQAARALTSRARGESVESTPLANFSPFGGFRDSNAPAGVEKHGETPPCSCRAPHFRDSIPPEVLESAPECCDEG